MLRRVWIKLPWTRTQVIQIYQHHEKPRAPGTHWDQIEIDDLEPAPLPGGARRGDWRWEHSPQGPVSTLLENVHWMASTLSLPSFTLRSKYDHTIHVMSDPFQHIRPSLHTLAARVAHSLVAPQRTVLQHCPSIDQQIFHAAAQPLAPAIKGAVYGVATLSVVDQSYSHRLDDEVDDLCIFCHACTSSVPHILLKCCHPRLVAARTTFS